MAFQTKKKSQSPSMKAFSTKIINWYQQNKRDLPWRNTKDPYFIWLSEIILQQTRVDQGMSYYLKFTQEFPSVKHLAKAENDKVMKLWQGLGYYSRARNLHSTAQIITNDHKGKFPDSFETILSLKGIGEYTASAIASFAFNKAHAVVDGNVYRVLSRVFGIETPIDSTTGKKAFNELANQLLDKKQPALHNQAIMEFGAMQCKPVNPNCTDCVLQSMCYAFEKKKVGELPIKEKKTKVRTRYFNYIVFHYKKDLIIHKRTGKDIWTSLYDFPLIETTTDQNEKEFLSSKEWKKLIGNTKYIVKSVSKQHKHILSHQKIMARFWEINCKNSMIVIKDKNYLTINKSDIGKYAVPRLIDNYLIEQDKD